MAQNHKFKIFLTTDNSEYHNWLEEALKAYQHNYQLEVIQVNQNNQSNVQHQFEVCQKLAEQVNKSPDNLGVIISGTGLESSLILNKTRGIRAALVHTFYLSGMTRKHNDSNVMVVGAKHTGKDVFIQFLEDFMNNSLQTGPGLAHELRVQKMMNIENKGNTILA